MKTQFFCLTFLLLSLSMHAQVFQAYYVTNSLDTIECQNIIVPKNPFHKKTYHFNQVGKIVKFVDSEGKKKFKPQSIAGFVLTNSKDGDIYRFISMEEDKVFFYHEIIKGKISLFHTYSTHPYDKSTITNIYLYKDNILTPLGMTGRKNKISLIFEDNPEIAAKWEAAKFDYDLLKELINEYNNTSTKLP